MSQLSQPNFTHQLQKLMQLVGISSFKALARTAGVSERQILRLRRGDIQQMRVDTLIKLAGALQMPLADLIASFSKIKHPVSSKADDKITTLQQEYQRLQLQLEQQRQTLLQDFQNSSLQILESWLVQWPTAAFKAQENPQISATKLLPLMRPLQQLLQQWGVEEVAPVGAKVPYNPQLHQLLAGDAQPGEEVLVRYTGYLQGDRLLYRAKVSLLSS